MGRPGKNYGNFRFRWIFGFKPVWNMKISGENISFFCEIWRFPVQFQLFPSSDSGKGRENAWWIPMKSPNVGKIMGRPFCSGRWDQMCTLMSGCICILCCFLDLKFISLSLFFQASFNQKSGVAMLTVQHLITKFFTFCPTRIAEGFSYVLVHRWGLLRWYLSRFAPVQKPRISSSVGWAPADSARWNR